VPAAVIDRIPGRRKARVGEGPYGDGHRLFATLFGVEQVCPADRAESKPELGALVANAHILGCGAGNLMGSGEGGECGKHTARPALTGEAVANADPERFALNFNSQLSARARGRSSRHWEPLGRLCEEAIIGATTIALSRQDAEKGGRGLDRPLGDYAFPPVSHHNFTAEWGIMALIAGRRAVQAWHC